MINRRNFIKLGSITAISLGSGFGFGKLFSDNGPNRFAVYGFMPEDKKLIDKIISRFLETVNSKFSTSFNNSFEINKLPRNFEKTWQNNSLKYYRYASLKIKRLNKHIDSDLIISDSKNSIYSLENNFANELLLLRQTLKGTKAKIFFSAEFNKIDWVSQLFNTEEKQVVIENESGIFDKLDFKKDYKNIVIEGPQGNTEISVNNGIVRVTKPTCRHKLCQHTVLTSNSGNVIACAPNKVLIRPGKS